jgi:hypothetical protein
MTMFLKRNTASAAAEAAQNSVYQNKGNVPTPHVLYVHYINRLLPPYPAYRFDHGGPILDIQQAVDDAVGEIQAGKEALPRLPDHGILWKEASYAVFVMTPSEGRLERGNGIRIWHDWTGKNHCFFNGADLNDVQGCSAMYCINFRKNRRGQGLGVGERERFVWAASHPHGFFKSLLLRWPFWSHENSGTNLGP